MTRWSFREMLAGLFVLETAWLLARAIAYLVEGWPVNLPWSLGLVLGPGTLLSAAWFVRRTEPPTLLMAALARTLVMFLAVAWNLILVYAITTGRFSLI